MSMAREIPCDPQYLMLNHVQRNERNNVVSSCEKLQSCSVSVSVNRLKAEACDDEIAAHRFCYRLGFGFRYGNAFEDGSRSSFHMYTVKSFRSSKEYQPRRFG